MKKINTAREKLDQLDSQLLDIIAERISIVRNIGELKAKKGMPVLDVHRERALLTRILEKADERDLSQHFISQIFRQMIRYGRSTQETILAPLTHESPVVQYQGSRGAFSWLAAHKYFSVRHADIRMTGSRTYQEAIDAVSADNAAYAVLPLENSLAGSFHEVIDLVSKSPCSIVGEEIIPIDLCLVALPGAEISDLQVVFSHPVILQQCARYLATLDGVQTRPHEDTAEAAAKVHKDGLKSQAAIASRHAAELSGLAILKEDITGVGADFTRFAIIAKQPVSVDGHLPAKTSLTLNLPNEAGVLASIVNAFGKRGINMGKLESRPSSDGTGLTRFYIELDENAENPGLKEAIDSVRQIARSLRVLGCYVDRARLESESDELLARAVDPDPDLSAVELQSLPGKTPTRKPASKKANYKFDSQPDGERSIVQVGKVCFGDGGFHVIAGPCAVETPTQLDIAARDTRDAGAVLLRGGVFKPRSSPYSFQGLGWEGLRLLREAGDKYGLPIVTEVMAPEQVGRMAESADMLQIGARNMQNFDLLREVGRTDRPILLKRGLMASIDEFLMAAEYIMAQGNFQVVLCERGIRTFETATRSTLDLSAVPVLRERTHLPICVDPSHAAGRRSLVAPLSRGARAVGADSIMVEIHPDPANALCDGPQALSGKDLAELIEELS